MRLWKNITSYLQYDSFSKQRGVNKLLKITIMTPIGCQRSQTRNYKRALQWLSLAEKGHVAIASVPIRVRKEQYSLLVKVQVYENVVQYGMLCEITLTREHMVLMHEGGANEIMRSCDNVPTKCECIIINYWPCQSVSVIHSNMWPQCLCLACDLRVLVSKCHCWLATCVLRNLTHGKYTI